MGTGRADGVMQGEDFNTLYQQEKLTEYYKDWVKLWLDLLLKSKEITKNLRIVSQTL